MHGKRNHTVGDLFSKIPENAQFLPHMDVITSIGQLPNGKPPPVITRGQTSLVSHAVSPQNVKVTAHVGEGSLTLGNFWASLSFLVHNVSSHCRKSSVVLKTGLNTKLNRFLSISACGMGKCTLLGL